MSDMEKNEMIYSLLRMLLINVSILVALRMSSGNWDGEIWVVITALGATGVSELITAKKDSK